MATTNPDARFEQTPPSIATVSAVAEATDRDPMALPPLFDTIDPDDLDALVTGAAEPTRVSVCFEYAGTTVTITDGGIDVVVDD